MHQRWRWSDMSEVEVEGCVRGRWKQQEQMEQMEALEAELCIRSR
jgi:hypothetical protein